MVSAINDMNSYWKHQELVQLKRLQFTALAELLTCASARIMFSGKKASL